MLFEQDLLARQGMLRIFKATPGMELAAVCLSAQHVVTALAQHAADVLLVGASHRSMDDYGLELGNHLRGGYPKLGVVVLGRQPRHATSLFAHPSAGRAYLAKDAMRDAAQLLSALRTVADGRSVVDLAPGLGGTQPTPQSKAARARLGRLTPRELEVLAKVASGDSNPVIGEKLGISKRAVEQQVGSIFRKLELANTGQLSRRVAATRLFLTANDDADEP